MKKEKNKKIQYIISIIISILICKLFLQIDNVIAQGVGVAITPVIIIYSVLLIKNEQKQPE